MLIPYSTERINFTSMSISLSFDNLQSSDSREFPQLNYQGQFFRPLAETTNYQNLSYSIRAELARELCQQPAISLGTYPPPMFPPAEQPQSRRSKPADSALSVWAANHQIWEEPGGICSLGFPCIWHGSVGVTVVESYLMYGGGEEGLQRDQKSWTI